MGNYIEDGENHGNIEVRHFDSYPNFGMYICPQSELASLWDSLANQINMNYPTLTDWNDSKRLNTFLSIKLEGMKTGQKLLVATGSFYPTLPVGTMLIHCDMYGSNFALVNVEGLSNELREQLSKEMLSVLNSDFSFND